MTVTLLLAAGAARRFGSQKLLATLAGGETLVVASARLHLQAGARVVAVVRSGCLFEAALETLGCQIVVNPSANQGMGTSIAAGVAATREADAWTIALADMPFVRVDTLRALGATGDPLRDLVVPVYRGRRGHPVRFPRDMGPRLAALQGDRGARALLDANHARIVEVETDDAGILEDIDRPGDLPA